MFAIGDIDPLLVQRFSGFDTPTNVTVRSLLSGGGAGPHQILQSSGVPFRRAAITGILTEEDDVVIFRSYDLAAEQVEFRDGRGTTYSVWVLSLTIEDDTDWWSFSAELIDIGEAAGS